MTFLWFCTVLRKLSIPTISFWVTQARPPQSGECFQLLLLDTLACAAAGMSAPEVRHLAETMVQRAPGPTRLPGLSGGVGALEGTFLLTMAACWDEACEGLARAHGRPGLHAVPAAAVLGSGTDQGFTDICGKSSEIQTAINQIKQLGITVGKTATTFAPDDNVTREEMALFISRLLTTATVGPGGNTEYVTGSSGAKVIKSLDTDHNFTDLNLLYLWESQTSISNLWNLGVTDAQSNTVSVCKKVEGGE